MISVSRRLLHRCAAASLAFVMQAAHVTAYALDLPGESKPAASAPRTTPTLRLRFPDVCHGSVVFTYAGELWLASTEGGAAERLTSGPGLKRGARFSPDCKQIAFTGQYDGDDQVYVMDAAGGSRPRQLTFYPAKEIPEYYGFENQVYGWSPDGKRILFRSGSRSWAARRPRL